MKRFGEESVLLLYPSDDERMHLKEALPGVDRIANLQLLLLEPRTHLLQLLRQVRQSRAHQLLFVLVTRTLADELAVSRHSLHLIRNKSDFALQLLVA